MAETCGGCGFISNARRMPVKDLKSIGKTLDEAAGSAKWQKGVPTEEAIRLGLTTPFGPFPKSAEYGANDKVFNYYA